MHAPMRRDYGSASQSPCAITGDPPVSNITAGATLGSDYCKCTGANQCAAVNSSSLITNATGSGFTTLSGALSALPFSNIRNETCFEKSALETATDTYRVSRPPHCAAMLQSCLVAIASSFMSVQRYYARGAQPTLGVMQFAWQ